MRGVSRAVARPSGRDVRSPLECPAMSFDESRAPNFARPMPNWQPLVEYRRNGVAENTIHGAVSWVTGRQLLYSFGANVEVYGRSMVKPLMMKEIGRASC